MIEQNLANFSDEMMENSTWPMDASKCEDKCWKFVFWFYHYFLFKLLYLFQVEKFISNMLEGGVLQKSWFSHGHWNQNHSIIQDMRDLCKIHQKSLISIENGSLIWEKIKYCHGFIKTANCHKYANFESLSPTKCVLMILFI